MNEIITRSSVFGVGVLVHKRTKDTNWEKKCWEKKIEISPVVISGRKKKVAPVINFFPSPP